MATRKSQRRKTTRSHDFAPEIMKEIDRQTQEKEEIENRRNKRKLIFWTIIIFGATTAAAISIAFLLLLGIVEW